MKLQSFTCILLFFIICVFSYTIVSAGRRKDRLKCAICPDVVHNYTVDERNSMFRNLTVQIWYQDLPLTPLARKFRRIILDLSANGSPEDFLLVTIASIMFNNFASFMDLKPDACVMAAMVNGTVSCHVDNEQDLLQDALTQLLNRFPHINYDNMMKMIMSADCDYECGRTTPDAVTHKVDCYKNGFVYDIEELWSIPKPPFSTASPKLRNIVRELYYSDDFVDNFIAATTSFPLCDTVHRLWAKRNPNFIILAAVLQFSKPIDSKCCYSRITRSENIREFNDRGAVLSITSERARINETKCQPPIPY